MKIIEDAIKRGADNLSEYESKQVLSSYGIPVTSETTATTMEETVSAANSIGYPVVLKASGENLQHKTERNLIRLDLKDASQVRQAYTELLEESTIPITEVLIQQMLRGNRELLAGLKRDSQFGPCVVFGLGGILAEILEDVSIRVAPITTFDAMDMMENIRGKKSWNLSEENRRSIGTPWQNFSSPSAGSDWKIMLSAKLISIPSN